MKTIYTFFQPTASTDKSDHVYAAQDGTIIKSKWNRYVPKTVEENLESGEKLVKNLVYSHKNGR